MNEREEAEARLRRQRISLVGFCGYAVFATVVLLFSALPFETTILALVVIFFPVAAVIRSTARRGAAGRGWMPGSSSRGSISMTTFRQRMKPSYWRQLIVPPRPDNGDRIDIRTDIEKEGDRP